MKKRVTCLASVCLCLLIGPPARASAGAVPAGAAGDLAVRIDAGAIAEIFADWSRTDRPGCTCAVSDRRGVVFEGAYGMANLELGVPLRPDSVFYVASVSKQFIAAAVALLVERGMLDWDADARELLPQLRRIDVPVTVRQLAQHTSGIRDYFGLFRLAGAHELDYLDNARVLRMLGRQHSLQSPPGTRHDYSNSNFVLLAELVAQRSGQPFPEFTQRGIFAPLGMTASRFETDHRTIVDRRVASYTPSGSGFHRYLKEFDVVGDGGLLSTAADLTAWGRQLMASTLLRPGTLAEMLRRGRLPDGSEFDYGLGHRVETHHGITVVGHTGSFKGFKTRLLAAPEPGIAVAVLCNAENANANGLADAVLDLLVAEPGASGAGTGDGQRTPSSAPPEPVRLRPEQLAAWAGDYWAESESHTRQIYVRDGVLYYGRGNRDSALEPLSASTFSMPGFGIPITLTFERDAGGERGLVVKLADFQRVEYREYVPVDASEIEPSDYTGDYASDELDARYRIDSDDGGLDLELPDGSRAGLQPVERDLFVATFEAGPYALHFRRSQGGAIAGFAIDSGWIRGLWLSRAAERRGQPVRRLADGRR